MSQFVKILLCLVIALVSVKPASGFSLIGPLQDWQVFEIGYALEPVDSAGPRNLGEEFRWNTPTIVYAYDPSFLDYFGQQGVAAVEKAIQMFNALPPVSKMSETLSEFPLDTRRFNYQATALGVVDLTSYTMSLLLEALGLSAPERWVFTLRSRVVLNDIPRYTTIKRNFDPVTLVPSSYVNGTLYTYTILQTYANPDAWEAVEVAVDPLAPSVTSVAALMGMGLGGLGDVRGQLTLFNDGLFYTGFTRDDVGGLRYLLRPNNLNVETLPTNSLSGTGAGLPWQPVGGGTNTTVDIALRPGVDKITFVRGSFDTGLGQGFTNLVTFTDRFYTNGVLREQVVQRGLTTPDILFSASDIGVNAVGTPLILARSLAFQDNDALNGASAPGLGGPGTMVSPVGISFSKIGPFFRNTFEGNEESAVSGFVWGSFDGTTNAPIIFPRGATIQELERLVLRQTGASPWRLP